MVVACVDVPVIITTPYFEHQAQAQNKVQHLVSGEHGDGAEPAPHNTGDKHAIKVGFVLVFGAAYPQVPIHLLPVARIRNTETKRCTAPIPCNDKLKFSRGTGLLIYSVLY